MQGRSDQAARIAQNFHVLVCACVCGGGGDMDSCVGPGMWLQEACPRAATHSHREQSTAGCYQQKECHPPGHTHLQQASQCLRVALPAAGGLQQPGVSQHDCVCTANASLAERLRTWQHISSGVQDMPRSLGHAPARRSLRGCLPGYCD